jgi:ankyrin repeat protein
MLRALIAALFLLAPLLASAPSRAQMTIELLSRAPVADAARAGDVRTLRGLLAAGQSANGIDIERVPALILAAQGGHAEAIELLLAHGARDGSTALFQAAQRGHDIAVSALLAGKAAIEIEGPQGETALIAAARRGHAAVVSLLLKAGADWKRQDHTGRTALRHAQDAGRGTIVTMLRRAGATQ